MRRLWSIIIGAVLAGLAPLGVHRLIKANQDDEKTNAKSRVASLVLLFTVITFILILAFSMEIRTFLTQLF